jgi:hypothetical protein
MELSRKDFIKLLFVVGAGGAAAACGPAISGANCSKNGAGSVISANHGHELRVLAADFTAGAQKTYDLQGSASHNHQVMLEPAHFTSLSEGNSVTVTSTNVAGHAHEVPVTCA